MLVCKLLKQPLVLGYILAGMLLGANVSYLPALPDNGEISRWAELGVIFLIFSLGLEFSFKKLFKVGISAFVGALIVVVGMMALGYLAGIMMGWSSMSSLFLGASISISSTAIVVKVFDDYGFKGKHFTRIVFGVLVVEDLFAVVLMVLLSTLAVSQVGSAQVIVWDLVGLFAFLFLTFFLGVYLIPSFFKLFRKSFTSEMLVVISIALCLFSSMMAVKGGLSAALGAFLMGSVLAETLEGDRVERLVKPLKYIFGAIFFVSVGMVIDLGLVLDNWPVVLIVSSLVVFGQIFFATGGLLVAGQSLRTSLQSSFSLTQIGEFAFLIAALGLSNGLIDGHFFSIVVAASVFTTFLTPFLMRLALPFYFFLQRTLPAELISVLERGSRNHHTINQRGMWQVLWVKLLQTVGVYASLSLLVVGISILGLNPLIDHLPAMSRPWVSVALGLLTVVAMSPFLRALIVKKNNSLEFRTLWEESSSYRFILALLCVLRYLLAVVMVFFVLEVYLPFQHLSLFILSICAVYSMYLSMSVRRSSILIEKRFLNNYNELSVENDRKAGVKSLFVSHLLSLDLHLEEFEVRQNSPSVGHTLRELSFRQMMDVSIVSIVRGSRRLYAPGGDEMLYPLDKIVVLGTDDQIVAFRKYIDDLDRKLLQDDLRPSDLDLQYLWLAETSPLVGVTLSEVRFREEYNCMVVGIERGSTSLLHPPKDEVFESGDTLWLVGEETQIARLLNKYCVPQPTNQE